MQLYPVEHPFAWVWFRPHSMASDHDGTMCQSCTDRQLFACLAKYLHLGIPHADLQNGTLSVLTAGIVPAG